MQELIKHPFRVVCGKACGEKMGLKETRVRTRLKRAQIVDNSLGSTVNTMGGPT